MNIWFDFHSEMDLKVLGKKLKLCTQKFEVNKIIGLNIMASLKCDAAGG